MTLDPLRTERAGRFADAQRGQGIVEGYQDAIKDDPLDRAFINRNLKRYRKFGVPARLAKLKGMDDTQLERMAAVAVLKRRKVKIEPLRERVNRRQYKPRQLARARSAIRQDIEPGKKLAPVVRHIRRIRRNRRVNNVRIWSGKGYDVWKGYT